jgi:hypothetical protein
MALLAVVSLAPAVAEAQVITAFVTRGLTGQPVGRAQVVLRQESITIDSAESNAAGLVTFLAPVATGLTIVARRAGYEPAKSDPFTMTAASNQFVEIQLVPNRMELDPIVVTTDRPVRHLRLSGFYDRRTLGFGRFMTREEIEAVTPTVTTDALRHVSGISIVNNAGYGRRPCPAGTPCSEPVDRRRVVVRMTRTTMNLRGADVCPPVFFLDGMLIGDGGSGPDGVVLDDVVDVDQVEAIEAYSAAQLPARFNVAGASCGVIVFWTR